MGHNPYLATISPHRGHLLFDHLSHVVAKTGPYLQRSCFEQMSRDFGIAWNTTSTNQPKHTWRFHVISRVQYESTRLITCPISRLVEPWWVKTETRIIETTNQENRCVICRQSRWHAFLGRPKALAFPPCPRPSPLASTSLQWVTPWDGQGSHASLHCLPFLGGSMQMYCKLIDILHCDIL